MEQDDNHDNRHNNNQTSLVMHHITCSLLHAIRTTHANVDNIRPIPTPILRIFYKCDTPAPYQPIKQGMVPDSSQCGEARQKVIPENIIWRGRSDRQCEHLLCPLVNIIHNTTILIHLDPISVLFIGSSLLPFYFLFLYTRTYHHLHYARD